MNKTVHQSSNHRSGTHSLSFLTSFPDVHVVSLTLEAHVFFETRIRSDELPIVMFQQVGSFVAKQQESHTATTNSRPQLFCRAL